MLQIIIDVLQQPQHILKIIWDLKLCILQEEILIPLQNMKEEEIGGIEEVEEIITIMEVEEIIEEVEEVLLHIVNDEEGILFILNF